MNEYEIFASKNHVVSYDDLVKKIIEEINDLPSGEMLSGDRFQDLWEEFAFQVQIEESYSFHAYEQTVKVLCEGIAEELPEETIAPLWEKSTARYEWDYEDGEPSINTQRNGITEELVQKVYDAAGNYELPSYSDDEGIIYGRKIFQYEEAVEEIIHAVRKLPRSSMQSGDDSAYEDVWEEYAAQVQGEEGFSFELYEDLVETSCYKLVRALTKPNLRRLWEETDAFSEWDDEKPEPDTGAMEEAVAHELFRKVAGVAANYVFPELDEDEDDDDSEEYEEDATDGFNLTEEDYNAVQVAQDVLRLFLSERRLTAQQVVGLGHALYALERLPKVTPGTHCDYGICYRAGNEEYSEMRYIFFLISEDEFEISTGGSVYDQSVGSDSISGSGWRIEIDGFADRELGQELYELENSCREYLNLGAEITVNDQSENIKFEEDPE